MVRISSITLPGSCHQTAAATTSARPTSSRPKPSRRCSGSRSRAERPMLRAAPPITCATPSQTAAMPRPSVPKTREMGPRPLRTARGGGRRALFGRLLEERAVLLLLPVLRDRVLDPPREPLRLEVLRDVLELRDPGGEDVRVAMLINLGHSHTSHRDHTPVSPPNPGEVARLRRVANPPAGSTREARLLPSLYPKGRSQALDACLG